jgi:RNA polymerase sigma-70 factor (sigma-E family)
MAQARTGTSPVADPLDSFEDCYSSHWWPMVRLATALLGDTAAAEDAVQEAFTGLYKKWPSLQPGSPVGYLRVSVVNAVRSAQRRLSTQRKHLHALQDPPAPGADERLARQGERDQLRAALDQLPATQREILVLRFISQLSDAEIADATGLSLGGVRSASSRGVAALRVTMGGSR